MPKAIKVEGLSKAYQLGDFGTGTISRDIERFLARVRGKEDPFLRIGETNDRTVKGKSDIVWCLKDLDFEIEQGDAVGIIGRNGAGKSTLLKILSRITSPTVGTVKVKGRVASLLEVGTGFHPELTGRENIYLNGAILGMRKKEIKRKFDEIVDFSGVERYIDTPVKRYSSGMYVRLAFAVAAHLESEILIVDEVLAVGDAEFQKKCLGKMGDVSRGEGRTVLFVSHNMGAIEELCNVSLLLSNGTLSSSGVTTEIVKLYFDQLVKDLRPLNSIKFFGPLSNNFLFINCKINENILGDNPIIISPNEDIVFEIHYSILESFPYRLTLSLYTAGVRLLTMHDSTDPLLNSSNNNIVSRYKIPPNLLRPGTYQLGLGGHSDHHGHDWIWNDNVGNFTIAKKWKNHLESINAGIININPLGERLIS